MASLQLFNAALTGAFVASKPALISNDGLTLFFQLVTLKGGDPQTTINYFLEFTDDPTGSAPKWFREVDEEDTGKGVITQSIAIRTFQDNGGGGGGLPDGTWNLSCQFIRRAPFARVQIEVTAGAATAVITCPGATLPISP